MRPAIAPSHGQRASSSGGVPPRIFSTLAGGCRSSPSRKCTFNRPASMAATVVLPQPETPITTTIVFIATTITSHGGRQQWFRRRVASEKVPEPPEVRHDRTRRAAQEHHHRCLH